MHFRNIVVASAAGFAALASSYKYPFTLKDTTAHPTPFYLTVQGGPSYLNGKNLALRSDGGDIMAVVDDQSAVLLGQLDKGALQAMTVNKENEKVFTGLTAQLTEPAVKSGNLSLRSVVFSKTAKDNHWSESDPSSDGQYLLDHFVRIPPRTGEIASGFIMCDAVGVEPPYSQLMFYTYTAVNARRPDNCYFTGIASTIGPVESG